MFFSPEYLKRYQNKLKNLDFKLKVEDYNLTNFK